MRRVVILLTVGSLAGCGDAEAPAQGRWAVTGAPVANDDASSSMEDAILSVAAPGVLGNDTDPEAEALTAELVMGPVHGTLLMNADGSFVYTPGPNFFGTEAVTYRARDASDAVSNVATVTIEVVSVNDAPVATGDMYSTPRDHVLTVPAPGLLSNDSDVDDTMLTLTVQLWLPPPQGAVTLQPDGAFSYTPPSGFVGADSFDYRLLDPHGGVSSAATVLIDVSEVTPEEQIETVQDQITALVEDGTLNAGNGNALMSKLDAALAKVAEGKCQAAATLLNAFINQVNALVASGELTPQQGQELIDAANAILQTLDC